MPRPKTVSIRKITKRLEGDYESLADILECLYPGMTEDDLTPAERQEIDRLMFQCLRCTEWKDKIEEDARHPGECWDCTH